MKHTDPRIEAALRAGGTDKGIARKLCTTNRTVATARRELGLPPERRGQPTKFLNPAAAFRAYTQHAGGGHLDWTGSTTNSGTPVLTWGGRNYTAYRVAFVMRWGRAPEGLVHPGCDHPRCVHPDHVEDQQMRSLNRTYQAIFGVAV